MAITTYKVFLMQKESDEYKKLIDIKDYPDLGGAPEMLQTTTLSNKMHTYEPGVQSSDALEFTANYDLKEYQKLKALEGKELDLSVWFGGEDSGQGIATPTGSDGKFNFKGKLNVYLPGGGVNEVVDMKIVIAPTTEIVESSGE